LNTSSECELDQASAERFVLRGAMLMMSWFDDRRIDLVASEVARL
jgi:hypothetical protein